MYLVQRDGNVAGLGCKALLVGQNGGEGRFPTLPLGEESEGGFVGIEVVLGSVVVGSTGEVEGAGQLLHHFGNVGDATVLVGGKGEGAALGYGMADVGKEIGVHGHGWTWYVVHPCGSQEDGIGEEVENTLFGFKLVAGVVVLWAEGCILGEKAA